MSKNEEVNALSSPGLFSRIETEYFFFFTRNILQEKVDNVAKIIANLTAPNGNKSTSYDYMLYRVTCDIHVIQL